MAIPFLTSDYPPPAFHFSVWFMKLPTSVDASFQEVSGIAPQMETDTVVEGGENRFVHQLPKAMKAQRLVLKRGIAAFDSPLVHWCRSVLEGGLDKRIITCELYVALRDELGLPLRMWSISNAWPVQWEVESFGARKNEVALEKIELSYAFSKREL